MYASPVYNHCTITHAGLILNCIPLSPVKKKNDHYRGYFRNWRVPGKIGGQRGLYCWRYRAAGRATEAAQSRARRLFLFQPHGRSEEHTSELQSRGHLVCRLLLEKKKQRKEQTV